MAGNVAFDRDVLRAFLRATAGDTTDSEGVAALRIFVYAAEVWVVPTVSDEITRDGSPEEHSWRDLRIGEIHDDSDSYHGCVTTKTYRYMDYHADPRECRVVVEAECAKLDAFLTLNEDLTRALADRVEQIAITSPGAYWASLNVPRGAEPLWTPGPGHPLMGADWWRW